MVGQIRGDRHGVEVEETVRAGREDLIAIAHESMYQAVFMLVQKKGKRYHAGKRSSL